MEPVIVTCIENPFEPHKSRKIVLFDPGITIQEHVAAFFQTPSEVSGYDVVVSVNGTILPDETALAYVTLPRDSVVFCAVPRGGGGGKTALRIVAILAVIALSIAAPYLAPAGWGALGTTAAGATYVTTTGLVLSAGVMAAGSMIVNALLPVPVPDLSASMQAISTSATYSWEKSPNSTLEGNILPELYGTCRVTPPVISMYIDTFESKQYLNILYAVAGHEVDSMESLRINGTLAIKDGVNILGVGPAATDYINFTGVTLTARSGAASQTLIPGFEDIRTNVLVGAKLSINWITRETAGNNVEKLGITFKFPKGLFYAADNGSLELTTVDIQVEQRDVTNGGAWTPVTQLVTTSGTSTVGAWGIGYFDPSAGVWVSCGITGESSTAHSDNDIVGPEYMNEQYLWVYNPDFPTSYPVPYLVFKWFNMGTDIQVITSPLSQNAHRFSGAQATPLSYSVWLPIMSAGSWEMRVKFLNAPEATSRYGNDVYFEMFTEVVMGDNLTYPGVATLALKALATDQLSGGFPRVDLIAKRNTIPGPAGTLPASNPAWACYHILHRGGKSIAADRIDINAFTNWADWCASTSAAPLEKTAYECHIYLDSVFSVKRAMDAISIHGRGSVVQVGSGYTCVVDRPEDIAVQRFLFGMGNILKDTLSIEYLPMLDRANSLEVTYFDAEYDYERQTVELNAHNFDTTEQETTKASVTLFGCTSRLQAIRHGIFMLNCNRYLTQTITFDADVDSIACMPGDVIEISHDVPNWGESGRIISGSAGGAVLDRVVTGNIIIVQHMDDSREEHGISVDGTSITLVGSWATVPESGAKYVVGTTQYITKKARVIKINRSQEMRRQIVALEYVEEVYIDNAVIPLPVVPPPVGPPGGGEGDGQTLAIQNLRAAEVYLGGTTTTVNLTWTGTSLNFFIWQQSPGTAVFTGIASTPNHAYTIAGLSYGVSYSFTVSPTQNIADGLTVTIALYGSVPPPDVIIPNPDPPTNLAVQYVKLFEVGLGWTPPTSLFITGVEIWMGTTSTLGAAVQAGLVMPTANSFVKTGLTFNTPYYFWVRSVNYNLNNPLYSTWVGPVEARTSADPGEIIGTLIGSITENELCQDLLTQIEGGPDVDALLARMTEAEADIVAAEAAIALLASMDLTEWESRLADAEAALAIAQGDLATAIIAVDAAEAEILLRATIVDVQGVASDLSTVTGRVSNVEIDLDAAETSISLKASQTQVTGINSALGTLTGRVTQSEIDIDGAEAAIVLKASAADVGALTQRVSSAEIDIDGAQAAIILKASQQSLDTTNSNLSGVTGRLSVVEVDLDAAESAITLKASQSSLNATNDAAATLTGRVSSAEVNISAAQSAITLKASVTNLNALDSRVGTAEADIDAAQAAILLRATSVTVGALDTRVGIAEVDIDAIEGEISLLATQGNIDALTGRVTAAEAGIIVNADAITLKASSTSLATTNQNVATAQNAANAAANAASAAQGTANTASTNADAANVAIADIAADDRLTPVEKSALKLSWDVIVTTKPLRDATADAYAITTEKTAYDNAYAVLNAYIPPLLVSMTSTQNIVAGTFRANFKSYYDAEVALLKIISEKVKVLADAAQGRADLAVANAATAQGQANTATSNASTAQTAANNAQNAATAAQGSANTALANAATADGKAVTATNNAAAANLLLSDIASDSKLTAVEKQATKLEWDAIVSNWTANDAAAVTYAITTERTAATNAYNALNTYLNVTAPILMASLVTTSDIVGATFRTNFSNYYAAETALLNAIALKARTLANAAQVAADAAQGTATSAQGTANTANSTANSANANANTAIANAAAAVVTANAASVTAGNAQTAANTANSLLADIASDSKLTPVEKTSVKLEWDRIVTTKVQRDLQADNYAITTEKTALTNAYNTLNTYLNVTAPILMSNLAVTSDIVGATFRANFKAYYDAEVTLLKVIADRAKTLADAAQAAATTATNNAAAAQATANAAQTAANTAQSTANTASATATTANTNANTAIGNAATANLLLADIANDNKLTASEKQATKKEWDQIVADKVNRNAQATLYGVSQTTYNAAYTALNTYLNVTAPVLLSNLGATSDIVGTAFRANFKAYYDAETVLLRACADEARTRATAAQTAADIAQAAAGAAQSAADAAARQANITAAEMELTKSQWTVKMNSGGRVAGVGLILYPTYDAGNNYGLNQGCLYGGVYYRSLQANNAGHTPSSSPTWWVTNPGGVSSEFIVLADKFAVMIPAGTGTPVIPFIVGSVQGVGNVVGINGTLVVDGSVTANKIRVVARGTTLNSDQDTMDATAWKSETHAIKMYSDPTYNRSTMIGVFPGGISGVWPRGSNCIVSPPNGYLQSIDYIARDPNKRYKYSFYAYNSGANGILYACLRQFNYAKTPCTDGGYNQGRALYSPAGVSVSGLQYYEYTLPASYPWAPSCAYVALDFLLNYNGSAGEMYIHGPRFEEMIPGDLIVDGSIQCSSIRGNALGGANYMNFDASGSQIFMRCGSNIIMYADGNAYFSRQTLGGANIVSGTGQAYMDGSTPFLSIDYQTPLYLGGSRGGFYRVVPGNRTVYVRLLADGTPIITIGLPLGPGSWSVWASAGAYPDSSLWDLWCHAEQ